MREPAALVQRITGERLLESGIRCRVLVVLARRRAPAARLRSRRSSPEHARQYRCAPNDRTSVMPHRMRAIGGGVRREDRPCKRRGRETKLHERRVLSVRTVRGSTLIAGSRSEEPQDRMYAAVHHRVRWKVELAKDAADVRLDRLRGDKEQLRDSAIRAPLR